MTVTDERLRAWIENCKAAASLRRNRGEESAVLNAESRADAYRELLERRAADRWIPVSERLPEVDIMVLANDNGYVFSAKYCINDSHRCGYWYNDEVEDFDGHSVTHWKPLPEPPKE